ncbi:popeye domain-containing protein 1-like isoform X3 [Arctopsyche grandis]|uniref:popeye domain-containing protein 1-like isoform X3 n=1 Tax=Arctopsyche grandis TaxID=121162 RepID=UPI00406D7448
MFFVRVPGHGSAVQLVMFFLSALTIGLTEDVSNGSYTTPVPASTVTPNTTEYAVSSTVEEYLVTSDMGLTDTQTYAIPPIDDWTNYTMYDKSFISAVFGVNYCTRWRQANHIYFQLANAFFFLSYLAPNGMYGLLFLRCTLLIGCGFTTLWAWTIECFLDAVVWNAVFIIINMVHISVLLFYLRPIKFSKEVEEVYQALFKPLRVSRHQFRRVLSCMRSIRRLKCQEVYAMEKVTKVDSLSLVLSGKLVVSQNQRALHIVFPHHFLDSPEWFGVSTDEYFQVSIMSMEDSRVLIWHRDKLKLSIMTDQFLQAVFDHILGRDVVHKLMQVSETMAASNGHLPNNYEEGEDKPMLIVKKSGDGPGITALINRQLQEEHAPLLNPRTALGDPNAWRLGRIEEADHETPV